MSIGPLHSRYIQAVDFRRLLDSLTSYNTAHGGEHILSVERRFVVKLSARNILKGKVIKIVPGAVNSEITIEMYGGPQIISVITNTSVQNLGLKEGKEAYAVIKASSVMITVD